MNAAWQHVLIVCTCTVALVGLGLGAALPVERDPANSFIVSEVADKTLCPFRVYINKNENRIPRYIKFITCDVQESESSDPQHCSFRLDADHIRSCVQLEDYAPVQYLADDGSYENSTLKVPVGCACMAREPVAAAVLS